MWQYDVLFFDIIYNGARDSLRKIDTPNQNSNVTNRVHKSLGELQIHGLKPCIIQAAPKTLPIILVQNLMWVGFLVPKWHGMKMIDTHTVGTVKAIHLYNGAMRSHTIEFVKGKSIPSVNMAAIGPPIVPMIEKDIWVKMVSTLATRNAKPIIMRQNSKATSKDHGDVIKWKHLQRYWPFLRTKASDAEIWCFLWSASLINGWINNRETGDMRRHRAHYDVIKMIWEEVQK